MNDRKGLIFDEVLKLIISNENYEVLSKYKCIEKIQKIIDEHQFYLGDFFDLTCFFRNATVAKIIKNQEEININDIKPNQMFFIDFRFESLKSTETKQKEYASRFDIDACDIVSEAYDEDLDDFVIFLYKEKDENEYDEVRKLLYTNFNF